MQAKTTYIVLALLAMGPFGLCSCMSVRQGKTPVVNAPAPAPPTQKVPPAPQQNIPGVKPEARTLPLATKGRFIVDQAGNRVKLAAVNWYGASDGNHIVGGLDAAPRSTIIANIRALGFNAIRLPFSNAMLQVKDPVPAALLAANPDLIGKIPLEIYDVIVHDLQAAGIYVILNNHTTSAVWCCGEDENALWFTDTFTAEQWMSDWQSLAQRYRDTPFVVGADLRNEVRSGPFGSPNWGGGDRFDWRSAAETAGNRILAVNPNLLIIVEGISWATDLSGAGRQPVRLNRPGRLVYSAHCYSWSPGPDGGSLQHANHAAMEQSLMGQWLYITDVPIFVGEFGAGPDDDHHWLTNFAQILGDNDLDFGVWPLNVGPTAAGNNEVWGLLTTDWQRPISDWRAVLYQSIGH